MERRARFAVFMIGLFVLAVSIARADTDGFSRSTYIVKFSNPNGLGSMAAVFDQAGVEVVRELPELGAYVVRQKSPRLDLTTLISMYRSGEIEYAEKDEKRWHITGFIDNSPAPAPTRYDAEWNRFLRAAPAEAPVVPNDPSYKDEYHLKNINAPAAWEKTAGFGPIVVAVVDTGVDLDHPDLKNQLWVNPKEIANGKDDDGNGYIDDFNGWDFAASNNDPDDQNGHGTHVAGVIGAETNNNTGIAGVNWSARIMAVRFLDARGSGSDSAGAQSILYAVKNGARIISCSWGSKSSSKVVQDAVKYAWDNGALVIAAAGNDSANTDRLPAYPAVYSPISVSAADEKFAVASFSNWGPTTASLAAPGVRVFSTYMGDQYKRLSGTSMATPVVSGVASLILAARPGLSAIDFRNAILNAAIESPSWVGKVATDGHIDALKALSQLSAGFQVWPGKLRVGLSQSFQFTAWDAGSQQVTWTSSNPAVATVDATGTVKAVTAGEAVLTAQDSSGKQATATVVVAAKPSGGAGGCGPRQAGDMASTAENAAGAFSMGLPLLVGFLIRRRKRR